ncbi:small integral membrane protein 22 [Microcaecilia unicolor]|uniref:Small integral membrane protein 22 n=1 Tax=Microcaecilia unicolor TaxID=1415580 RepID=A0A6P7YXI3_9AMPH|nr:small integral membrane protein 22 [Microcaecilia unicolor]XP_030067991.1 small integral membrane protein 22 [Microcaecilia unicolor]
MSQTGNLGADIESQINDALSRLASKQMFQSDWDIAAFVIFFTFIGIILLLIILVLIRCCCCCCCDCEGSGPRYQKAAGTKSGVDNLAMEP